MNPSSVGGITEFAIVVAGFTGLVLALGARNSSTSQLVKFRTVTMLFFAFTAAFGSLLPLLMQSFGVETIWRYSGLILVFLLGANMLATLVSSRLLLTVEDRQKLSTWMWLLVMIGNAVFAMGLLFSIFGLVGLAVEGAFVSALVWQLVLSSVLFTRLIVDV